MLTYSTSAEIVYQVSRQLNTSLDLDEVLGKVLRLTVEATEASRGSLFLLNEEGRVLRLILARPNQSPEVSKRNVNMVMAKGLAGWVYRHQYGALAADTTVDERWVQLPDDTDTTGSALVVPLLYQDRVSGLLALHHEEVRFFDESHLALAAGIAGQAAVAVENAWLFTQVKKDREELYALINAMPLPVLVIAGENVSLANATARQSLPVKEVGGALLDLPGGQQLKTALDKLQLRTHRHVEVQWPDERVFNVSINEVARLGTVVALDDISHLKQLDAMKTQFVETVSHDLQNPVGVILGFTQLLEQEQGLSEAGQACVDGIFRVSTHMQQLIDDLLDLAKIEAGLAGQVEACAMPELIEEVLADFKLQLAEKQLTLVTAIPSNLPPVAGNMRRLGQVVANYISNAIKYTPKGGRITVALGSEASEIWLRVSDNGPGIPPAAQKQLFQKFYRVPEVVRAAPDVTGTGLGLSIVKAIVESCGGRVWVDSEVGVGTSFGCHLPVMAIDGKD